MIQVSWGETDTLSILSESIGEADLVAHTSKVAELVVLVLNKVKEVEI